MREGSAELLGGDLALSPAAGFVPESQNLPETGFLVYKEAR